MDVLARAEQMRELDRTAIEELGIPSLEMMERAAAATVKVVLGRIHRGHNYIAPVLAMRQQGEIDEREKQIFQTIEEKNQEQTTRIAIFCGPGNNGGDGVAAARLLMEAGCQVRTFLVGDRSKMTPDEKAMEERLKKAGGALEDYQPGDLEQNCWRRTCDGIVDAIFGVGLSRPVEGKFRLAIEEINRSGRPVISCDIPSGVNADTGEIMGCAVRADATVTFTCAKPGLYLGEGGSCAGEIFRKDIGIPPELVWKQITRKPDVMQVLSGGHYILPRRHATAHKGDFGKVFILAGCEGYTGAPVLTSRAAVRTGAGLVYLGSPEKSIPL